MRSTIDGLSEVIVADEGQRHGAAPYSGTRRVFKRGGGRPGSEIAPGGEILELHLASSATEAVDPGQTGVVDLEVGHLVERQFEEDGERHPDDTAVAGDRDRLARMIGEERRAPFRPGSGTIPRSPPRAWCRVRGDRANRRR